MAFRAIRVIVTDTTYDPDIAMLRDRLLLPMAADTEEAARRQRIAETRNLISTGQWDMLLSRLAAWEEARRITAGRSSFVTEALFAVQKSVTPANRDTQLAPDTIDSFEAGLAARPDNHLMAAVLAMAHVGLGWHWLGGRDLRNAAPANEERFRAHFTRAADVLAPFDAVERFSPAVAVAQYHLFAAHPQAGQMIGDWFADWTDLDPQSIDPYLIHAVHLLPRWFGADDAALDRAALRAAAASADTLGAAAYALLYLGQWTRPAPKC